MASRTLWRDDPATVRPMLAVAEPAPLRRAGLVYEPKYDGIRALVEVDSAGRVAIRSRLGRDKTRQFPEVAEAFARLARRLRRPLLVDGEIVALDERGEPAGFQRLQGRMHLTRPGEIAQAARAQPAAFVAFDLLHEGDEDLRPLPLVERRRRLERLLGRSRTGTLRLAEQARDDGRSLRDRALAHGWEGLIAKEAQAPYWSGRRSPAWRKIKLQRRQEFVVGGWTEPRGSRRHLGALLLGVYENGRLRYVGHMGTGFDERELARLHELLVAREIDRSPFATPVRANERAHWVRPELVVEAKFAEWTADGRLRAPVYLGLREDRRPEEVVIEPVAAAAPAAEDRAPRRSAPRSRAVLRRRTTGPHVDPYRALDRSLQPVVDRLAELEAARRDGVVELPDGTRLEVTNLAKVFWPEGAITKGELLRYYAAVAPLILPAVADRPLVMRRFPNGIRGKAFYQQRLRLEKPPPGVRIEVLPDEIDPIGEPGARRFVGGNLTTLLYMAQMAAISQDPWFSRVQSPLEADYAALDLDPGEGVAFARVLEAARHVHDELERLRIPAVPKTSGASGLHIYIPLPPRTSYDSAQLLCRIVATLVAERHPKVATVERRVARRPPGTVYIDYLQNILGKTLATAYSARASEFAGVSTPLTWKEVHEGVDPRDFTLRTAIARFREAGDLWARLRKGRTVDLEGVLARLRRR
ncbi:MAG TPA: DNA ligase D [Vicinamibacterales bacterium]|nr:DNA ligase D [Vicinamibacterales bacterium]